MSDEESVRFRNCALVFSGGIGLAAYHAGAFEEFVKHAQPKIVAGSSAGAITSALIAGNRPGDQVKAMQTFWLGGSNFQPGGWSAVARSRLSGHPGFFAVRPPTENMIQFKSIYDLAPLRKTLERLVDFEWLNKNPIRFCLATTDIETGDPVTFDTARGDRITVDHILASCGFLPEFAPVKIGERLLGDGGLSLNAPFELVFGVPDVETTIIVDLFARDGRLPTSLIAAAERKNDLIFGNQTFMRLKLALENSTQNCIYISYRDDELEPGAEKPFDLSVKAIRRRWGSGSRDMAYGLSYNGSRQKLMVVRR